MCKININEPTFDFLITAIFVLFNKIYSKIICNKNKRNLCQI